MFIYLFTIYLMVQSVSHTVYCGMAGSLVNSMFVYVCVCVCVCMYEHNVCTYIHRYIRISARRCVCMYVCMNACAYKGFSISKAP